MSSFSNNVILGKGQLDGKGVYANRDFMTGEIVIEYHLKKLTLQQFNELPKSEKKFTHRHWGVIYLYSEPERYVNHATNPNTYQDHLNKCDIALRAIKKGELITTNASKDDIV